MWAGRSTSERTTAQTASSCGGATAPRPAPSSSKTSTPAGGSSFPLGLTDVGGTLYFSADDGTNGIELWRSDGTAAGTVLVKDINPGGGSSIPLELTDVGGTLYFRADDGTNGFELWRSDGTAAGTVLVKDINPAGGGSSPLGLTDVGGTLYFSANDGTNGIELWRSDGTAAGTVLVKDINPGGASSSPVELTDVGGTLYFRADDGTNGFELWRSDGSAAGTVLVKDINPAGGGSSPSFLTEVGGTLYFRADDGTNGIELWRSDGTAAGTVLVEDINPGGFHSSPDELTDVGGTLYFRANDGTNGAELWVLAAAAPVSVTVLPVADSYVDAAKAATNFGANTALRVDGSPVKSTYLRFDLTGLTGTISSATLRVYADTAHRVGYDVYAVADTSWDELGISFNHKPTPTAGIVGSSGPVDAGSWTSVDVTSLVSGGSLVSFALATTGNAALRMQSRENTNKPELVVVTTTDTTAPTLQTLSPADDATAAAAGSDLVATFNEPVMKGTGDIVITETGGGVVETIPITSAQVAISGAVVTINPANDLANSTDYHVQIAATAIDDTSGNSFAGILDTTTWNFTTAATTTTAPFTPVADSYIDAKKPTTNFGTNTALRVDGSPIKTTYLRFNVTGLTGTVTEATLRIWADTAHRDGYDAYAVPDTTWIESGTNSITYNHKPSPTAGIIGSSGPVTAGSWTTVNVTPLITGNGPTSIALTTTGNAALRMQSKENTHPPQLIITTTPP